MKSTTPMKLSTAVLFGIFAASLCTMTYAEPKITHEYSAENGEECVSAVGDDDQGGSATYYKFQNICSKGFWLHGTQTDGKDASMYISLGSVAKPTYARLMCFDRCTSTWYSDSRT